MFRWTVLNLFNKTGETKDIADMEASRFMYCQKLNEDHLKLAVDILDNIVRNSHTFDPAHCQVFMLQLCMNRCDVKQVFLVDRGVYCMNHAFDLSLPSSPIKFATESTDWFKKLTCLKNNCYHLMALYDNTNKKSYNSNTAQAFQIDYQDWIRDSFYPPCENELVMPKKLYGAHQNKRQSASSAK
ncbi:hypothetical protein MUCCIDRAFT_114814 [Mucor lusitanicus CBS 277.49]|uniref:Uncharacterized protein n=1 Tax=Mucor lusitanicus CBS 277.49 TaxID=747725 RepID=A0A168I6R0_MUCCL|nr:hypothetical protein MUCCIDRAFT_114814 [Mucor lusitanicus CBS 277.49]